MPSEVKKDFFGEEPRESEAKIDVTPDQKFEAVTPGIGSVGEVPSQALPTTLPGLAPTAPTADPILNEVEEALSDGLQDIYKNLPDDKKMEFKQAGEAAARGITVLIRSAKFKISQILELILAWLKIIPGVNKFFLKQEAKIRADRVLEIVKEEGL